MVRTVNDGVRIRTEVSCLRTTRSPPYGDAGSLGPFLFQAFEEAAGVDS